MQSREAPQDDFGLMLSGEGFNQVLADSSGVEDTNISKESWYNRQAVPLVVDMRWRREIWVPHTVKWLLYKSPPSVTVSEIIHSSTSHVSVFHKMRKLLSPCDCDDAKPGLLPGTWAFSRMERRVSVCFRLECKAMNALTSTLPSLLCHLLLTRTTHRSSTA